MKKQVLEIIGYRVKSINQYIENYGFTWKEVRDFLSEQKIELQDDDLLEVGYEPDEHSHEDAYSEPRYYIKVSRWREHTPEEKQRMKDFLKQRKERDRENRYQDYLKLREEFKDVEL